MPMPDVVHDIASRRPRHRPRGRRVVTSARSSPAAQSPATTWCRRRPTPPRRT